MNNSDKNVKKFREIYLIIINNFLNLKLYIDGDIKGSLVGYKKIEYKFLKDKG